MPRSRPAKNLDTDKIEQYAMLGLSRRIIANLLNVSEGTIRTKYKKNYELGRAKRMTAIAKGQWDALKGGNVTMLIWLGKNDLGQSDQPHSDGNPEPELDPKVG